MGAWRRVVGVIKDRKSIWIAHAAGRSPTHNPDLEEAVVRATSHGELYLDYKKAGRVFLWARTSPSSLRPLLSALGRRLRRTSSWPVALKGLLLLHGLLSAAAASFRLPFDLSAFADSSSPWGYSAFVRAYFAFLRQRIIACTPPAVEGDHLRLQQWLLLLDVAVRVRPVDGGVHGPLIMEAMGCAFVEMLSIHAFVRKVVFGPPARLAGAAAEERAAANRLEMQTGSLAAYTRLCGEMGVLEAAGLAECVGAIEGGMRKRLETVVTYEWERF